MNGPYQRWDPGWASSGRRAGRITTLSVPAISTLTVLSCFVKAIVEPLVDFLRCSFLDLWGDVHGDDSDCSEQDSQVVGVAHAGQKVRDDVNGADEIRQGSVDDTFGPDRCFR